MRNEEVIGSAYLFLGNTGMSAFLISYFSFLISYFCA
ncbi:MAG: hypothetical protein RLZZ429_481 [Bacteroidota bacterium]|jgi:hypothetical protein